MALSWSFRRQLLYYVVVSIVGVVVLVVLYATFLTSTPTCTDGKRNGSELGVDCGGSCSMVCKNVAFMPRIRWARSFESDTNLYSSAAYVENPNPGAGAKGVRYSFRLYDEKNVLIVERDGVTDLPPTTLVPIVETDLSVGLRIPVRTVFSFAEVPTWNTVAKPKSQLILSNQQLATDGSRLSAVLVNNSVEDMNHVSVVAVLFDEVGIARGASKTTVNVAHRSSQPIVFTWPKGVPNAVNYEMTILPSF